MIALLVFGPGKLPEVGAALGRGIREFRDATGGTPAEPQPSALDQSPPARPALEPWWQAPEVAQRDLVAAEPRDEGR